MITRCEDCKATPCECRERVADSRPLLVDSRPLHVRLPEILYALHESWGSFFASWLHNVVVDEAEALSRENAELRERVVELEFIDLDSEGPTDPGAEVELMFKAKYLHGIESKGGEQVGERFEISDASIGKLIIDIWEGSRTKWRSTPPETLDVTCAICDTVAHLPKVDLQTVGIEPLRGWTFDGNYWRCPNHDGDKVPEPEPTP